LQNIALLITAAGIIASILFQVSLSFSKYSKRRQEKMSSTVAVESSNKPSNLKTLSVLKNPELYKIALLYTFSRLFLVICIIYIPIWLNEFMKTKPDSKIENIALVPLIFFVSSFAAAFLLKYINQSISHKVRKLLP
jgi:sugar phosphate permease